MPPPEFQSSYIENQPLFAHKTDPPPINESISRVNLVMF